MKDDSDPLNGWDLPQILSSNCGAAKNDVYGKLYHHVKTMISSFHRRLSQTSCHFQLFNMNAKDLPNHLEKGRFARIEVVSMEVYSLESEGAKKFAGLQHL